MKRQIQFPEDFTKKPHPSGLGGFQWKHADNKGVISVIGGGLVFMETV